MAAWSFFEPNFDLKKIHFIILPNIFCNSCKDISSPQQQIKTEKQKNTGGSGCLKLVWTKRWFGKIHFLIQTNIFRNLCKYIFSPEQQINKEKHKNTGGSDCLKLVWSRLWFPHPHWSEIVHWNWEIDYIVIIFVFKVQP